MNSPANVREGNRDRSFSSDTLSQVSQVSQDSLDYNPDLGSSLVDQTLSDSVFARSEEDDADSLEMDQAGVKDRSQCGPQMHRFHGGRRGEPVHSQRPWVLNDGPICQCDDSGPRSCADGAVLATSSQHLSPSQGSSMLATSNVLESQLSPNNSTVLQSPLSCECVSTCEGRGCQSFGQEMSCPDEKSCSQCACSLPRQRVCGPWDSEISELSEPGVSRRHIEDEYLADDEFDSLSYAGERWSLCDPGFHEPSEKDLSSDLHQRNDGTLPLCGPGGKTRSSDVSRSAEKCSPSNAIACGHSVSRLADNGGARLPLSFSGQSLHKSCVHRTKDNPFHFRAGDPELTGASLSHTTEQLRQAQCQGGPPPHAGRGSVAHSGRWKLAPASWDAGSLLSSRPLVPGYDSPTSVSGRSSLDTVEEDVVGVPAPGVGGFMKGSVPAAGQSLAELEAVCRDHRSDTVNVNHPVNTMNVDRQLNTMNLDRPLNATSLDHPLHTVSVDHPSHILNVGHSFNSMNVGHSLNTTSVDAVDVLGSVDAVCHDHPLDTLDVGNMDVLGSDRSRCHGHRLENVDTVNSVDVLGSAGVVCRDHRLDIVDVDAARAVDAVDVSGVVDGLDGVHVEPVVAGALDTGRASESSGARSSGPRYDPQLAKLKASISWILTKAYGSSIPAHLKDPFYENAKGQLQVKPQLINLMTSSELYCQACSNMFSDTASQWQGHWSIIQVLSRKGIYVAESGDVVVTETVLMQTAPFRVAAHLSLIDALMKAYASEIASVERVAQAVRRYASFNASSELPSGIEEALVFWINKTCAALDQRGDLDIIQGESNQKVRIVSKTTPRDPKSIPKMEDLMSDLGDGCCVAATIAFYQPDNFPVTDVCLKECVGIADSLYNLRLIRMFCERHLALKCFHFTYEDLLYGRENLKENVLVFLAELFFLLEAMEQKEAPKDVPAEGSSTMSVRRHASPSVPQVSSATKRSFQKAADDGRHYTDKISASPSGLSSRQPLLQKRTSRRSQSLSSPQEREVVRHSVLAWQDDQDIRERTGQSSMLLENVSMSWDADTTDDTDLDPVSSADLAEFEATGHPQPRRPNLTDPSHPEYMEVISVTPGQAASMSARSNLPGAATDRQEPLMPAKLRRAKEKVNNHSKAEERGDRTPRKKVASPTKPTKGKLSPPGSGSHGRISPGGGVGGESELQRSSGSSMDDTIVTPLASAELVTPRSTDTVTSSSDASVPQPPSHPPQQQQQHTRPGPGSGFEAFVIPPDSSAEVPLHSPRRTVSGAGTHAEPPATSYTLESAVHDAQTAREVGLPVIGQSGSDFSVDGEIVLRQVEASREGSVGSSRSSGDFSDHESHKIHQDHKARESLKHSPRPIADLHKPRVQAQQPISQAQSGVGNVPKPGQLITDHLPNAGEGQKKPGTTSFAEIRRMKGMGNVDNSGYVYMQHGQEPGGDGNGQSGGVNLKAAFGHKPEGSGKKATFARLPNETTWQQSSLRSSAQAAPPSAGSDPAASNGESQVSAPAVSELSQLRLKLEEKRREIERKKQRQEVQTAKMRQRLGKAAFMRVISKQDESTGSSTVLAPRLDIPAWSRGDATDGAPSKSSPLTQAALQERLGQVNPSEPTRPTTLTTHSPASSSSTSASASPSAAVRGFSREGIQQTIDGVRRRWFHGSDPEGDVICSKDQAEDGTSGIPISDMSSDMMQSCPPAVAAAAFGYSPRPSSSLGQEARVSPAHVEPSQVQAEDAAPVHPQLRRELSQSPRRTPERRVSSGSGEQDDYDQSLNKLNRSLTELQGEIKRLTLQQQEQFRGAQSPQEPVRDSGFVPSQQHPHLPPQLQQQQQPPLPQQPLQPQQQPPPPSSKTAHSGRISTQHPSLSDPSSHLASALLVPSAVDASPPSSSPAPSQPQAATAFTSPPQEAEISSQEDDSSSGNGFFVSFGEDTPRRPKPRPKLGKVKDGASKRDPSDVSDLARGEESQRVPPLHEGGGLALAAGGGDVGSNHSGSHHSLQSGSDDSTSGFGYVMGQDSSLDAKRDEEMQRKKERLIQLQQRRKEDQERKRLEKEMETQRRLEMKMMKEEEQARKKAEEKARKEAIFQQYLQKKLDQDEEKSPPSVAVTRRERANHSQPRPKSMFAKARPLPDYDSLASGGVASHSSQEDLSSNMSPSGSTAPPSPFRLNPNSRGKMRKAVSCNQLTQNGSQGASTYRRPPSPAGRRPPSPEIPVKRSGPRSHDSGSDTGSQPGSYAAEYTGPKLFVKPSSKSNRHIIVNALSYCCLAGIVNTDLKNKVLEEIARSTTKHFLILFRDHGCQYRGLYSFDPEAEEAYKIIGVGPRQLTSSMVERFYKYNSGGKSFNEVTSTKHLSVSIDAVVLKNSFWKSKGGTAAKR